MRNVSIIAHVDHGKTTLSDGLIAAAGKLNSDAAGKACVLDVGLEAERGITIQSTAISLAFARGDHDLMINLIDSPGHVDFNSEVTAALRLSDGAVVVVDVLEGCCVQTETVLRQALAERVRPIVCLNKTDRLILELGLNEEEMFDRFTAVIEAINELIRTYQDPALPDATVSLQAGTVMFGSGYFGWMADVHTITDLYLSKVRCEAGAADEEDPGKSQHSSHDGNNSSATSTNNTSSTNSRLQAAEAKVRQMFRCLNANTNTSSSSKNFRANFCKFALGPIVTLHRLAMSKETALITAAMAKLQRPLSCTTNRGACPIEELRDKDLLRMTMRRFQPVGPTLTQSITRNLPSPAEAQRYRASVVYTGDGDESGCSAGVRSCDASGPLVFFASKLLELPGCQGYVALGRVFSGTVRPGDKVKVLASHRKDWVLSRVHRVVLVDGHQSVGVSFASAGSVCGLVGLDHVLCKSGTVVSGDCEDAKPCCGMSFSVSPVVRMAVSVVNKGATGNELAKLTAAMQKLSKGDPCVQCFTDSETKEHIIAGSGELHLEVCLETLRGLCPSLTLAASDAVVSYRETITSTAASVCLAKSQNKHNRVWVRATPLSEALVVDMESGELSQLGGGGDSGSGGDVVSERARILCSKYGWERNEARRIWEFVAGSSSGSGEQLGAGNVLVDCSVGVQNLQEIRDHIVSAFYRVIGQGPLANERVRGVRFDIVDAKVHSEGAQRRANQVVPACVRAMTAAMLSGSMVLVEPVYAVEVQVPRHGLGTVHALISRRRGSVESSEQRLGDLFCVSGFLPVAESTGFTAELRSVTHGQGFPTCQFSHWRAMSWGSELVEKSVRQVRGRKGLAEALPSAEQFMDKL